ncbi:LysR family transcriptional regulator (plasmid) [Burkholderia sp. PAMC 28687]|jgi:LysR family transcriptional regulator of abg operon|uniref:LysR substrate-binding domain-containing protein n=1 Tax=Burkholderia sp. PAMC 28687 TaxID=1795874 RepID=UPI000781B234|nr:LysR substrate-binding domain-containing protein [Burkholderia sp. PAMC 28687]AMM18781.1 LysR family transcriptional regulator [Burkholderia sp. PAMC 28687]
MKLNHLRDLLAVVERGSIRAAAKHLGTTQPALSRSIRELEKDIGVPLIERRAKGAVLTPSGTLFVRRASAAMNELRRGREEIEQLHGAVHGTVVVCLSSLSNVELLPAVLVPFRKRYPLVRLRIIEGVYPLVETRLRDGTVDFYVGPAPQGGLPSDLVSEKLFDNTRIVLARKGHPLGSAKCLAELTDAEWITTAITEKAETEFSDLFASHNLPTPHLAIQADSGLTWIVALANSDMLAISPRQWAGVPLVHGLFQQIRIKESLAGPSIVLVQRAAIPLTPASEHLCDLLRRTARHIS